MLFRSAGGGGWQHHPDRRHWEDGEHRHTAGVCNCFDFGDGVALYESRPVAAVPDAVGAADSNPRRNLERVHDVQAGLGELGAAGYLAGDRAGRVLHLRREAQPGAGFAIGFGSEQREVRSEISCEGLSAGRGGPFCFKIGR